MATDLAALKDKNSAVAAQPKDFPGMLEKFKGEIARALPAHITPERMSRIALTAFRLNPKLAECVPASVFAAVIMSSQLGLEIGVQGRAYLVPYKVNKKTKAGWESHYECQFIPGWKGLVDLMSRSGRGSVWTGAVFEGDSFDWELGDSPFVKHKPKGEYDPKKLTHVYAIGHVKGADHKIIEVWPISRVRQHRDRYNKVGDKHYSFENWEMYARKIPLLQILKYMPMTVELATAVALDDSATVGRQNVSFDDAIDGTWVPVSEEGGNDGNSDAGTGGTGEGAGVETQASVATDKGKTAGVTASDVAKAAGKSITELTPAEYVDRINAAETDIRIDEILDIVRSRKDFNDEDMDFVNGAASDWKKRKVTAQQGKPARRGAVD